MTMGLLDLFNNCLKTSRHHLLTWLVLLTTESGLSLSSLPLFFLLQHVCRLVLFSTLLFKVCSEVISNFLVSKIIHFMIYIYLEHFLEITVLLGYERLITEKPT